MRSRDAMVDRRQQELADADVVDEQALFVDDVDDVERFAVLAVRADVIEDLAHGPVLAHRDIVRRHQTPDRPLRIAEQRHGDRALFRRQQRQQLRASPSPAALRGTSCGRRAPCC